MESNYPNNTEQKFNLLEKKPLYCKHCDCELSEDIYLTHIVFCKCKFSVFFYYFHEINLVDYNNEIEKTCFNNFNLPFKLKQPTIEFISINEKEIEKLEENNTYYIQENERRISIIYIDFGKYGIYDLIKELENKLAKFKSNEFHRIIILTNTVEEENYDTTFFLNEFVYSEFDLKWALNNSIDIFLKNYITEIIVFGYGLPNDHELHRRIGSSLQKIKSKDPYVIKYHLEIDKFVIQDIQVNKQIIILLFGELNSINFNLLVRLYDENIQNIINICYYHEKTEFEDNEYIYKFQYKNNGDESEFKSILLKKIDKLEYPTLFIK